MEWIFVYDRRRHKLPEAVQRAIPPRFLRMSTTVDDGSRQNSATELQTAPSAAGGNGLQTRPVPPPVYAKPQKRPPASPGVAAPGITDADGEASASGNNGSEARAHPPPIYAKPQKRSPVSPSSANEQSSVYSGTSTTLIDNALYRTQQQPLTSSNVAEPEDDLTVIDNDLYKRQGQGQQNSGSTDYECTLIDNDLYR